MEIVAEEPKPAAQPVEEMADSSSALVFMYNAKGVFERVGFETESEVIQAEEKLLKETLERKYQEDRKQYLP